MKFSQDEIATKPDNMRAKDIGNDAHALASAATVTIPGGVLLTTEEQMFRDGKPPSDHARAVIVARSILTKVRSACVGDS